MEQMFGGLAKRAAAFAIVAMLMAGGLVAGSALGSGFAYSPAVAQEGGGEGGGGDEGGGCENDHCGRVDVRWWFDRDACLPNGDEATGCDATDQHGNCDDTGCNN